MDFRLIDSGWDGELCNAAKGTHPRIRIICPFVKYRTIVRLLKQTKSDDIRVITRFNLDEMVVGVNDAIAIRYLLDLGAHVRGIRNVHSKMYLFGDSHVIVTSANLSDSALLRNHEFGFVSSSPQVIENCSEYFDGLWSRAGSSLGADLLEQWEGMIADRLSSGAGSIVAGRIGDFGADLGFCGAPVSASVVYGQAEQAFVKLFGEAHNRAENSMPVIEEIRRSGSHWACTYPKGKRPRSVRDGAVLFMGRMVKEPNDILVYGRAIGSRHIPGRDDASARDIEIRPWKAKWPHYVRVHQGEFVDGELSSGVSLNWLMEQLGAHAFAATSRNVVRGFGNANPRKAYRQQAAVELTPEASAILAAAFDSALVRHGRIPTQTLADLDKHE
jgi:hypothetical protein